MVRYNKTHPDELYYIYILKYIHVCRSERTSSCIHILKECTKQFRRGHVIETESRKYAILCEQASGKCTYRTQRGSFLRNVLRKYVCLQMDLGV